MNRALEQYRALDNSFAQQREHQLLTDLTQAVEQNDGEMFSDRLFQYDQMSKLDNWKTTLLLRYASTYHCSLRYSRCATEANTPCRVKNQIGEAEDDFA